MIEYNLVSFGFRTSVHCSHPTDFTNLRAFVFVDTIAKGGDKHSNASVVLAREKRSKLPVVVKVGVCSEAVFHPPKNEP
jgi:hypothetical protein